MESEYNEVLKLAKTVLNQEEYTEFQNLLQNRFSSNISIRISSNKRLGQLSELIKVRVAIIKSNKTYMSKL